ncbi:hypothetical protein A8A54_18845 [Brucella pseudogrignonensis]|uniref:ATP-binding protein n=1 Tax=Brucella pseudogrignonensis TaxID=419475 RepID=UPI0007DA699B|nr:ATP-binding protein [Brucella pseudogrignonensis]ANG98675.1 hypothetical protein A8A54_18845 [Brucella pseudogrignonensis]
MDDYSVGRNISDSSDYIVLSRPDAPQLYISKPYQWDIGIPATFSSWAMSYARRINDREGNFNGYVLIVIDEAYLYGFYRRLDEQPGMVVGLVGNDGIIRASNDYTEIGRSIPRFKQDYVQAGGGIQIDRSSNTDVERVFANYLSAAAPLVAFVGVPTTPIYKAWIAASSVVGAALAALFAALVALGIVLGKYMRNRSSLMRAVLQASDQRREKEFLETIVNTGAVLMIVTDADGRVIVANQAMRALFPDIDDFKSEVGAISRPVGQQFSSLIDNLPLQAINNVVLTSGRKRALSWSVSPIRNNDGTVKNLVAVGLDITERREAELAIYQSGKLITLGEVASGIAHEINQPLATLAMAIFNLQTRDTQGTLDEVTVREGLALAANQVDRAARIIRHMRIYGHRSDGSLQSVDPVDAIEGGLTMIGTQIEKQGIEIRRRFQAGKFHALADLILLEQIILNLLLNARDAILDSQDEAKAKEEYIEIGVERFPGEMVAITVTDTGPGIPPSDLDRLFEPFFTTKPVGKGTGLGLSLSYGMARDMGGVLEAKNGVPGAEFCLILREARETVEMAGD